jgi:pimeloyl-ACP methyl ester carboxylesterase
MTRARFLLSAVVVGALVAVALAARFGGSLALALTLALPALDRWHGWLGRASVRETVAAGAGGRAAPALDLYRPAGGRPRGTLVLVHGLSPAGRHHPSLARLARLLAERGHTVLVPELDGLAAFRLSGREVETIDRVLGAAAVHGARVSVAGLSFGAGPALLAALRHPDLRIVGSFGGYADLRHVITFVTTGVHEFEGRRYVRRQEEYNRWKLLALLAGFIEAEPDRTLLHAIAERKLANPFDATGDLEVGLGDPGQAILALALNQREDRVGPLLAQIPAPAREALVALSPLPAVSRLPGRLLIAHGAGDESIPFTESLHLAAAAGGGARAVVLETFQHAGPRLLWDSLRERARDGVELVRLADALLAD